MNAVRFAAAVGGIVMLERLGHFFGSTGDIFAVLTLMGTAWGLIGEAPADRLFVGLFGVSVALVFFGIGRALRYIFAGPKRSA